MYVHGIDLNACDPMESSNVSSLQQSLSLERKKVEELESQMKQRAEQRKVELEQVKLTATVRNTKESSPTAHVSLTCYLSWSRHTRALWQFLYWWCGHKISYICSRFASLVECDWEGWQAWWSKSLVAQLQAMSSLTTLLKCCSMRVLGV